MGELFRRLDFFLHRRRFERDLEDEMRHHLALKSEALGVADARREFGNVTLLQEDCRTMWIGNFAGQLSQDARYALRMISANRLFAAMAVISLALGIGANTAIYSFVEAILLRSVPLVSHPEQLVVLNWRAQGRVPVARSVAGTMYRENKAGRTSPNFPFGAYEALRANPGPLSAVFGYTPAYGSLNLVIHGQADTVPADYVSGNYYASLGVAPAAGRFISDDDDRAGAPPVAVISYKCWERRFGLDPSAIGRSIVINNISFTVLGVTPQGFFGVNPAADPGVSLPLHAAPLFAQKPDVDERRRFLDRNFYWLEMFGRLRPDVTFEQAQSRLASQFRQFAESTASSPAERANLPSLWLEEGRAGRDGLRRQYSTAIFVLMAMVGLILAIACANIANLLLARAASRRREIAVRLSLGAGRWNRHAAAPFSLGQVLVVGQVALSLMLVIAAGLFVHTLVNLNSVHLGFQRENILLFKLNARPAGYKDEVLARFYAALDRSFQAIPGVRSAAFSNYPLSAQNWHEEGVVIPGVEPPPGKPFELATLQVAPSFLTTMSIPVLSGRGIEDRDVDSPRVAVVNEQFAKEFLGGANPVGRSIAIGDSKAPLPADIEIVGVSRNAVYNSVKEEKPPALAYIPYTQEVADLGEVCFELRTAGDPLELVGAVRRVVHDAGPTIPVSGVNTQSQQIDQTISQERTLANLGACLGILALVIACVGLYGTIAYAVARRTGEIGIRMALGARSGSIVWMVLRQVVALVATGLAIGFVGAWETTRFVKSFLFGGTPNDPLSLSLAVGILAAAALVAAYAPARRAGRTDPMAALRCE